MPNRMYSVLDLRNKALKRHAANKSLLEQIAAGQKQLSELRAQHLIEKAALENAYRLVLN